MWKKLEHENIVTLYEVIDDDTSKKLFMISEFVDGGAVMDDDAEVEPIALELAANVFSQLVSYGHNFEIDFWRLELSLFSSKHFKCFCLFLVIG